MNPKHRSVFVQWRDVNRDEMCLFFVVSFSYGNNYEWKYSLILELSTYFFCYYIQLSNAKEQIQAVGKNH